MSQTRHRVPRFRTLLLAPLVLAACTRPAPDVPQMGYVTKIGEQFRVSFRTSNELGRRFLTGGGATAARLECELEGAATARPNGTVGHRIFRAPLRVVRRSEITPDGRFQFSATGNFIETGGGTGARRLADGEIEAAIAVRTALPCRFLVPDGGDRDAVLATMHLPSLNVHAAIRDIPPYDIGSNGVREGTSR